MKRRVPPALVIGAVALFRLSLMGRGAMAHLDETNYYKAGLALDALRHGHPGTAIFHMSWNSARPGLAAVQLVPAALQGIPFAFGVSPSNPYSLLIPVAFNVLESLIALYFFWRISVLMFDGDETAATIATGTYGLLLNSNAYVRHLMAMEPAMALGMIALWLAVSREKTPRLAFGIGVLALLTMAVYPGYYLFAGLVCVALVGSADVNRSGRVKIAATAAAGAAVVLMATELFCRIGGVSYVGRLTWLARRIDLGSFDEGWTFLPEYMIRVESLIGAALLAGTAIYVAVFAIGFSRTRRARAIDWLVLSAVAAWMFQAVNAHTFRKIVLYGRLIHPWMPFMVWATLDVCRRIPRMSLRRATYVGVIAASLASWMTWAPEYRRLDYPADALYRLGVNTALVPAAQQRCDMESWDVFTSPAPLDPRTGAPYTIRADWVLVNFCVGPVRQPPPSDTVAPNLRLVYRAPHFITFRGYEFENFTPAQRADLELARPELRVYAPE
jgi:hypothetical protein